MQRYDSRQTKKWIWILFVAFVGFQIYYIQELVACLLLFSVLFLLGAIGFAAVALAAAGISKLVSFTFPESVADAAGEANSTKRPFEIPALRRWTASFSYGSLRQAIQLVVARANRAIS